MNKGELGEVGNWVEVGFSRHLEHIASSGAGGGGCGTEAERTQRQVSAEQNNEAISLPGSPGHHSKILFLKMSIHEHLSLGIVRHTVFSPPHRRGHIFCHVGYLGIC